MLCPGSDDSIGQLGQFLSQLASIMVLSQSNRTIPLTLHG